MLTPKPYTGTHPKVHRQPATKASPEHVVSVMLILAADPTSELFHRAADGVLYRRTGAGHRSAFWAGYDEVKGLPVNALARGAPGSLAAACYKAGKLFAKAEPK